MLKNLARGTCRLIRRFKKSDAGNVTMILGLSAIPILAASGVAIDYVRGTRAASELQQVSDSAALAAASAKNLSGTTLERMTARKTIAMNFLDQQLANVQDLTVNSKTVTVGPNTVDIAVDASVKATFLAALNGIKDSAQIGDGTIGANTAGGNSKEIKLSIHSKIGYQKQSYVCLLGTDLTALPDQIYFQGNSEFQATCSVWANSKSNNAIETSGNATAEAESFCSVGGWSGSGFSPSPAGGCARREDPYKNMALPTVGSCLTSAPTGATIVTLSNKSGYGITVKNNTAELQPGVYCGGLHVETGGIAKLKKGLYIIKNGTLDVASGGSLYADGSNGSEEGVVFYLTGSNTFVRVSSGGTFKVTSPNNEHYTTSTAAYKGFAIMQDRTATTKTTCTGNDYNGISSQNNGQVQIQGGFYSPNQILCVTANGDINTDSKYFPMIVKQLKMNGTATLFVNNDYEGANLPEPVELKTEAKVSITQ